MEPARCGALVITSRQSEHRLGERAPHRRQRSEPENGSPAAIRPAIAAGFNGGTWFGAGGVARFRPGGRSDWPRRDWLRSERHPGQEQLRRRTGLTANDVLVKYTHNGDKGLFGTYPRSTISRSSSAAISPPAPRRAPGSPADFNYSGDTTLDDFMLLLSGYGSRPGFVAALSQRYRAGIPACHRVRGRSRSRVGVHREADRNVCPTDVEGSGPRMNPAHA